jgi:hypothetical protein
VIYKNVIKFQVEKLSALFDEIPFQIYEHWKEVETVEHPDWAFELDHSKLIEFDRNGIMKTLTGRNEDNEIVMYLLLFVMTDLVSKSHLICTVYHYWFDKRYRNRSVFRFIEFTESYLKELKVEEVNIGVRFKNRMGKLLINYLGYHPATLTLRKKLNG